MAPLPDSDHNLKKTAPATIGILSFETARAMSRLVSIYNSLTNEEIVKLKEGVMRSQGVAYLNSKDERFLLSLAFAEKLEDLNRIAVTASRLAQNCSHSHFGLNCFDQVYANTKLGLTDVRKLEFGTKSNGKTIELMEKLISATTNLYSVLQSLAELELEEKKIEEWKKNTSQDQWYSINIELFNHKIAYQRKQVRYYKGLSLWNQTFDKSVGLITRIICIVYARICTVFGPDASSPPHLSKPKRSPPNHKHQKVRVHPATNYCLLEDREKYQPKTSNKLGYSRFRNCNANLILSEEDTKKGNSKNVFQSAPPSTVGGSGLALRYANVIMLADKYLNDPKKIGKNERTELYEMLPERLKVTLKWKLKGHWLKMEETSEGGDGHALAEGWREALEGIMGWLVPMAYDTMMWMSERNLERQKMNLKANTMLLQTLHYSDLEKAEAAIVEVLVGLSCICKYDNNGFWDSTTL